MESINTKKVIGFLVILFVPSMAILSLFYILLKEEDVKGVEVYRERNVQVPYITNLMPKTANVGEEYIFVPRVVANDFSSVNVTMQEGPKWMGIDDEGILRGFPLRGDIGTYKVVLKVEDEVGSSIVSEYVIVVDDEE